MVGSLFSLHHIINGCPTEQIDLPTNNKWLLNSGNTFNFYIIFFSQKKKLLYHILHLQTFSFKEHPANSTLNLDSNLMESLFSLHHIYYYLRASFSFFLVQKFSYTPIFKGSFGYSWKLKTEKYCSKIIFKCVNNIMGPIFNEKIAEKWGSCDWKVTEKVTVYALFTLQSQQSWLKKKMLKTQTWTLGSAKRVFQTHTK